MFSSVGWGEVLILIVAALVILGPERLPGAISWVMGGIRKVRDYATGAQNDLQEQLGADFDTIREPLQQLNELRQMSPKAVITKHLFDGDSSTLDAMQAQVGELESSVRDSLSISGPAPTPQQAADRPRPATPASGSGRSAGPDPARLAGGAAEATPPAKPAARKHDFTDWDAT